MPDEQESMEVRALAVQGSPLPEALELRRPVCGMGGWEGRNLIRDSYSGCPCCGFCY